MKFQTTPAFDSDWRRLAPESRRRFIDVVSKSFGPACTALAANPATKWPASLRVKRVRGTAGILEMTWSFAGPDGRATFELVDIDGEMHCRWRRIGDHVVFNRP
jgi:hypothetical protein